eukprot:gene40389-54625_t
MLGVPLKSSAAVWVFSKPIRQLSSILPLNLAPYKIRRSTKSSRWWHKRICIKTPKTSKKVRVFEKKLSLFGKIYIKTSQIYYLSLVRSFAELHGGEMLIESTVGEGTSVTVRLPVLLKPEQGSPPPRGRSRALLRLCPLGFARPALPLGLGRGGGARSLSRDRGEGGGAGLEGLGRTGIDLDSREAGPRARRRPDGPARRDAGSLAQGA